MEDRELVRLILKGDEDAFSLLVDTYQRRIYAMAYQMTRSEQDALDLSQEIFLRIYRSLGGFRFQSSLSTWIYHLASNLCLDFLRAQRSRPQVQLLSPEEDGNPAAGDIPDDRYDPQRAAEQAELQEALNHAVESLSDAHREIFLLREVEGLGYEEIALRLNLELGTVKSRIARAREQMRAALKKQGNFFPGSPSKQAERRSKSCVTKRK